MADYFVVFDHFPGKFVDFVVIAPDLPEVFLPIAGFQTTFYRRDIPEQPSRKYIFLLV